MAFYDNFIRLCAAKGKSPSAVAIEIGLKKSNVTYWKNNRNNPSDITLLKLAHYFQVPVEALIADQKEKPTTENGSELSKETIQMLLDKMSAAELVELMGDITDTLKRRGGE